MNITAILTFKPFPEALLCIIGVWLFFYPPTSSAAPVILAEKLEIAIDDSGYVHISGNMHNASSLIYFRSKHPWNIDTFITGGTSGKAGCCVLPISNIPRGVYILQAVAGRSSGSLPDLLLTEQVVLY